jgi:hypothetical protein
MVRVRKVRLLRRMMKPGPDAAGDIVDRSLSDGHGRNPPSDGQRRTDERPDGNKQRTKPLVEKESHRRCAALDPSP